MPHYINRRDGREYRTSEPGAVQFKLRFTGRRANLPESYRAGQVSSWPAFQVVPRDAIRGRRAMAGPRIMPHAWADSFPELAAMRGQS